MRNFVDLFCGIGGFHIAAAECGMRCVFACDSDAHARRAYAANFSTQPEGDIARVSAEAVPDHDLLCAGFPCQPFSIIGARRGFDDARGTLFFEIARVAEAKKPAAMLLENVRQLATHNRGKTLARITDILRELGYASQHKILNAMHFGPPQKRERVLIAAMRERSAMARFEWPRGNPDGMRPLSEILEPEPVDAAHYASDFIRGKRAAAHAPEVSDAPRIWHENKGGNISSHPFSCALRASASHNYLLVNGIRRLTPREMLRLQGFPDSFRIVCNTRQTRSQAGNAAPPPMLAAVLRAMLKAQKHSGAGSETEAESEFVSARAA